MDAADDGIERQRTQLLGSGSEQMNLKNTRQRASDLREQLVALIHLVRSNPASLSFESILEKFAIINAQFAQMVRDLRPQLRFHAAHPLMLDEQSAQVVPSQLATRVLPEMEAQEAAYLEHYPTPVTSQSIVEKSLVMLCNLPDAHNKMINNQFQAGVTGGPLHDKSAELTAIKDNSAAIKKKIKGVVDGISKVQKKLKVGEKAKTRTKDPSAEACAMVLRTLQGGVAWK